MLDLSLSLPTISAFAICVGLSALTHILFRPVAKEALASVSTDPNHLRNVDRVMTNLCKAASLMIICSWEGFWQSAYDAFVLDQWNDLSMTRKIVIVYTMTDASSFLTTWMPPSTFFHHAATTLFAIWVCLDPSVMTYGAARLMLWYGLCSSLTFCVNGFIATLYLFEKRLTILAHYCLVIYGLSLAVNWMKLFPDLIGLVAVSPWWASGLYLTFVSILVYDDQRLMRKLFEFSSSEDYLNKRWSLPSLDDVKRKFGWGQKNGGTREFRQLGPLELKAK